MRRSRQESSLKHVACTALSTGLALGIAVAGCSKRTDEPINNAPVVGHGDIATVDPLAMSATFYAPLDGTPSPRGDKVYFTAMDADGAAVFAVASTGGQASRLASSDPLVAPFGIVVSTDGTMIYVADSGAEDATARGLGRIFAIPEMGGTPRSLEGAAGMSPRSLDLVNENGQDQIYFTGIDLADGVAAVFKMDSNGLGRTIVQKPLGDPSGVTVNKRGVVYVADGALADGTAGVVKIENGIAGVLASGMRFGHPAGIALVQDESALLVSGLDVDAGTSVVYRVELPTGTVATFNKNISMNHDSAGLHRAHEADIYAWANCAGSSKADKFVPGGTVYLLKGQTEVGGP